MRRIQISKADARVLDMTLATQQYALKDLRIYQHFADQVEDVLGDYQERLDALQTEADEAQRELRARYPQGSVEAQRAAQDIGADLDARLADISREHGETMVELLLEEADYQFVRGKFTGIQNFNGGRAVRRRVLAIADALDHAETVKVEKVKVEKRNGRDRSEARHLEPVEA